MHPKPLIGSLVSISTISLKSFDHKLNPSVFISCCPLVLLRPACPALCLQPAQKEGLFVDSFSFNFTVSSQYKIKRTWHVGPNNGLGESA